MKMTDLQQIKEETALAIQKYRELQSILNGESINAVTNLREPQKKERAILLLHDLQKYLMNVDKHFQKASVKLIPVMEFGPSHARFLSEELIPNAQLIIDTVWETFDSNKFYGLPLLGNLPTLNIGRNSNDENTVSYSGALNDLVDFWLNTLAEDEKDEYYDFIRACIDLREIINGEWFDPDTWSRRQVNLRPILLPSGTTDRLRDHIRIRISEIYRTYIFGQFMASVALSRTLLEFVLNQNAMKLGISLINEKGWEKSLHQIINDLEEKYPDLYEHAEAIREHGNMVIHPKKRSIVSFPRVLEKEALTCIEHVVEIVEWFYRGNKG
ncbi:MAG: hypothetical protein ACJASF_002530 [Vicingaceae bacterium]|jgi:hypothetical protein